MSLIPFAPFAQLRRGAHLLALAVRFVDRQIFVARRTEGVEHTGFFDRLNTVRNIGGEIKGIPRLHFVRCSTDNQFHSPRQNVDDLLVRVLVRRHLAAGLERRQHLVHCFSAR